MNVQPCNLFTWNSTTKKIVGGVATLSLAALVTGIVLASLHTCSPLNKALLITGASVLAGDIVYILISKRNEKKSIFTDASIKPLVNSIKTPTFLNYVEEELLKEIFGDKFVFEEGQKPQLTSIKNKLVSNKIKLSISSIETFTLSEIAYGLGVTVSTLKLIAHKKFIDISSEQLPRQTLNKLYLEIFCNLEAFDLINS